MFATVCDIGDTGVTDDIFVPVLRLLLGSGEPGGQEVGGSVRDQLSVVDSAATFLHEMG